MTMVLWAAALFLLTGAAAYFCGCFNGSIVVSKYILHDDIRTHGSGNAGLTNFCRVFGGKLTFVVLLTDLAKGVAAVLIGGGVLGHFLGMPMVGRYWAGLCCLLGHMFPCMFEFKGGKGVLTGGAVAIMLDWRLALAVWGVFLVLFACTRIVSLGSICGGIMFPLVTCILYWGNWGCMILSICLGGLVVWKHRENLKRLLNGTESKFTLHKNTGEGRK